MLDNLADKKLILASKSPRRQELLKGLDISFEIRTKDVDESYPDSTLPKDVAEFLADKKAKAFMDDLTENEIVITSDTVVVVEDQILEKPQSKSHAIEMISSLSGKKHQVITGVCIQSKEKKVLFSDTTAVWFSKLEPAEIEYYVETRKPYDKAGAYGVQEWIGYIGIERLDGSYYTVMGLPLHRVYAALKNF